MTPVWLPENRRDIRRLYEYLMGLDANAARRMLHTIRNGVQALLRAPRSGKRVDDETGRRDFFVPFGVGAYVLRYHLNDDTVVITRVWHSRESRGE